jgi:opacity protein-like surface antigen
VISYRTKSRFTPFAHALFGFDRTSLKASTITGLPSPVVAAATNYTDFAYALGPGVDYKLARHFALRGGVDYFHTSINQDKFYMSVFGPGLFLGPANRQRNVRFSAGFVVSF